jgi:RNA polymerase sigma-70 factor (ECF subfamily)
MTTSELTDEELVEATREGRIAAFDELYQRYAARLYGYIGRLIRDQVLAEDLFQDVFFAVLKDQGFNPRRGSFAAWIFTVARNRCLTEIRDARRYAEKLSHLHQQAPAAGKAAAPEDLISNRRDLTILGAALERLSEEHRDVLVLKQLGRLSYREIAQIQGVPEGTVKSRLHFAIRELRQLMPQTGES